MTDTPNALFIGPYFWNCHDRSARYNHFQDLQKAIQHFTLSHSHLYGSRYKSAQLKLIEIMHARKAVPGRPILRPALREEARKHIGDTGLLDHLLKHMTDTVVSTGERFRRRHNSEGAMEYWLEHPSLMELRKAAGVEDPSWIPPPGWKPGDRLAGRHWQINRGMTASEAAEMKSLKETVDKLKRFGDPHPSYNTCMFPLVIFLMFCMLKHATLGLIVVRPSIAAWGIPCKQEVVN